jgi:hypothetical protein
MKFVQIALLSTYIITERCLGKLFAKEKIVKSNTKFNEFFSELMTANRHRRNQIQGHKISEELETN